MRPLEMLGMSMLAIDLGVGGLSLLLSNPFQVSWSTLLQAMLLILLLGEVMLLADWARGPHRAVKYPRQTSVPRPLRVCVNCGATNPLEASYCPACGRKLASL